MNARAVIAASVLSWLGVVGAGWLVASDFEDPEAKNDAGADAADDAEDEVLDDIPKVTALVEGEDDPTEIGVDDDWVYWLDTPYSQDGALKRAAKDGSNVTALAEHLGQPSSLYVDGEGAWYLAARDDKITIELWNLETKTIETVVRDDAACSFNIDDKSVYFTTNAGAIKRYARKGRPVTLVTKQSSPCSIAVDDSGIYWANRGSGQPGEGSIVRAERDGKDVTVLAEAQFNPQTVRVDAGWVYWATGDGTIHRVNKGGSAVEPVRITQSSLIASIDLDASHLFWTEGGSVLTKKKTEQEPTLVADGMRLARGVAIDSRFVYFTDFGTNAMRDGRVLKAPRP